MTDAYQSDLAYIHDQGYGGFARGSAPGLLNHLHEAGIRDGLVVDLGCGSGIWARELVHAGFRVLGVDLSGAMIEIARRRVPEAEFQVGSFVDFSFPGGRAITALGEVLNYLFDPNHSLASLRTLCERALMALPPGGLFIFDIATRDRHRECKQAFTEGDDWICLVEYQHDDTQHRLIRRIITFRKIGDTYRRRQETHVQQLFAAAEVRQLLIEVGFQVELVQSYGEYRLADGVIGVLAKKPS